MISFRAVLIVGIAFCLYGLLYAYLARRLLGPWRRATALLRFLWCVLLIAAPISLLGWFAGRLFDRSIWTISLQWVGLSIMGWFYISLVVVTVRDVGLWLFRTLRKDATPPPSKAEATGMSRRAFLQKTTSVAVAASAAGVSTYGIRSARKTAALKYVDIPIANLHDDLDGFVILQLSDIHVGDTIGRRYVERIVARCKEVKADLIAITGDLVDGDVDELRYDVAPIFELSAEHGVYFVTGNHEYYVDALSWIEHLRANQVDVLLDEHRVIQRGEGKLILGGITDYSAPTMVKRHTSDPHKAFEGAPKDGTRVLLAHQPRSYTQTRGLQIDLQLSGHTHGGQIWPFTYLVLFQQPFSAGLHRVWDSTWLYISRGTGYWGPPMRVASPSEITVITLRKASE